MKIKCTHIDWDVQEEDVYDYYEDDDYRLREDQLFDVKSELPDKLTVEVNDADWEDCDDCEEDQLEVIANALTDETGWLVRDFDFTIV